MLMRRSIPRVLRSSINARPFHKYSPFQKITPFLLADIGEGIKEVEIIEWHIKEGDPIHQFDKVAEVQSDKANVEISSRYDGVVKKLYYKQGEVARVGKPLIDIETADHIQEGSTTTAESNDEHTPNVPNSIAIPPSHTTDKSAMEESLDKVLTTPAVRRIAKEHNLDLRKIKPTGPRGRLLKEDLLNFIKNADLPKEEIKEIKEQIKSIESSTPSTHDAQEQVKPFQRSTSANQTRDEPVRGLKRTMIKTMNASNQVPQFGVHEEINVDKLIQMRNDFKLIAQKRGVEKLTFMPFFIKALSMSLQEYPILNSSLSSDEATITYKSFHNVGIAMDTPQGLLVPNIKNVQDLSILEIAQELTRLMQLGQIGKLSADDLKNGTVTLSNVGTIGGTYARPLITPPEVCIGAIGKMRRVPVFVGKSDEVVAANIMYVSWSGDHRIVDGATLTRFSNAWKNYLETPEAMMLNLR